MGWSARRVLIALAGLLPLAARADGPTYSCKDYSQLDENGEPVIVFTNVPTDPRCRPLQRASGPSGVYRSASQARRPAAVTVASNGGHGRYVDHIKTAAEKYKLPEAFIIAVMAVESNFDPAAVSEKGAMGLMQLMPGTARDLSVHDPFDPAQNIEGGVRYLRILANQYKGDPFKTLAAYNAGPDAVRRSGDDVPNIPETRAYVRRVLDLYRAYKAEK